MFKNNKLIIDLLSQLCIQSNNIFRIKSFQTAIKNISNHKNEITSGEYAKKNISGIGKGIADRIDEILKTGTLKELNESDLLILKELMTVTGIGKSHAKKLVKEGFTDIKSLNKAKLTHHQEIGLKYYEDLKERIPRKEMVLMDRYLNKMVKKIDSELILEICGSYRRELESSGDIDVLITHPLKDNNYLKRLVNILIEDGFIIDNLTKLGNKKYMGIAKIDKKARRIDIRYIDYPSFWAGVLYFTGSKEFNVNIRNEAIKKGYSLSEYGLKDKISGELIELKSEEHIFELLGIDYIKPKDR